MTITYTQRDYDGYVREILARIRERYPTLYTDFNAANMGTLLIDMAAHVGDVGSYCVDVAVNELFAETALLRESDIKFARSVGYVPRGYSAARAVLRCSAFPASVNTYGGVVRSGQTVRGDNGLVYEVLADTDVPAGAPSVSVEVAEGVSHVQNFTPQNKAYQTITTVDTKVAAGSEVVRVGGVAWTRVASVALETSASETYDVSYDAAGRAVIRFGNSVSGAIPSEDGTISYRTCNGAAGNCAANAIRGSLTISLNPPATPGSTATAQFVNFDEAPALTAATLSASNVTVPFNGGELLTGQLSYFPVIGQTCTIRVTFNANSWVDFTDNGIGGFTVSNKGGVTIWGGDIVAVDSSISYDSGVIRIRVPTAYAFPVGASTAASSYQYLGGSDPTTRTITGEASGGDDPETVEEMRVSIPAYVRSQDYLTTKEDYASAVGSVPGVSLSLVDVWTEAYRASILRFFIWSSEVSALRARNRDDGTVVTVPYRRFIPSTDAVANNVQVYLRDHSLLTAAHVIVRPKILWLDLYLSPVQVDPAADLQSMRTQIAQAIAASFENAGGFAFRISTVYDNIRNIEGVRHFNLERVVAGYRSDESDAESVGSTTGNQIVAAQVGYFPVSPGSVTITIDQPGGKITLVDDGSGKMVYVSGGTGVVLADDGSNIVNYATGYCTFKFTAGIPSAGGAISVKYRDVQLDFRREQQHNTTTYPPTDPFPPAGTPPYSTPPSDGKVLISAAPYRIYDSLKDIVIAGTFSDTNFYDETYLYDGSIYYNSSEGLDPDNVRAINCRLADFAVTRATGA
jgi:hypothetical protein